jgi:hypothetical protein
MQVVRGAILKTEAHSSALLVALRFGQRSDTVPDTSTPCRSDGRRWNQEVQRSGENGISYRAPRSPVLPIQKRRHCSTLVFGCMVRMNRSPSITWVQSARISS